MEEIVREESCKGGITVKCTCRVRTFNSTANVMATTLNDRPDGASETQY